MKGVQHASDRVAGVYRHPARRAAPGHGLNPDSLRGMDAALGLAPLTPLAQLDRAADYFPGRVASRFEGASTTYADLRDQVRRAAGLLAEAGVQHGDRVAVLARNVPVALLAHFAVPWAGGVLVALNHRLSAREHLREPLFVDPSAAEDNLAQPFAASHSLRRRPP